MKKNTFFKRSLFGGFKREDVINYIDNMKAELESAKKEIDELREKSAALSSSNEALTEETDKFRSENVSLSMSLAENTLTLNNVKAELDEIKIAKANIENENKSLKEENEDYKGKIARAAEIESHVGGMIADAKIYKEKLISDAKIEIDAMSASYRNSAEEITKKIDFFTNELNDLSSSVSTSLSSIMDSLIKMSNEIEQSKKSLSDKTTSETSSGVCGYSLNEGESQRPQPVLGTESAQNADASFSAVNTVQNEVYGDFSSAFKEILGFNGSIIS